jgi:hypothetical protein
LKLRLKLPACYQFRKELGNYLEKKTLLFLHQHEKGRPPNSNWDLLLNWSRLRKLGAGAGKGAPAQGATVLDRVHQSMILFAAGRAEALRRFLVDEGAGRDERFWRLAQVLSYLYPKASDENRWIDGVLARKKGLGF